MDVHSPKNGINRYWSIAKCLQVSACVELWYIVVREMHGHRGAAPGYWSPQLFFVQKKLLQRSRWNIKLCFSYGLFAELQRLLWLVKGLLAFGHFLKYHMFVEIWETKKHSSDCGQQVWDIPKGFLQPYYLPHGTTPVGVICTVFIWGCVTKMLAALLLGWTSHHRKHLSIQKLHSSNGWLVRGMY
jgi:hypothetical protein